VIETEVTVIEMLLLREIVPSIERAIEETVERSKTVEIVVRELLLLQTSTRSMRKQMRRKKIPSSYNKLIEEMNGWMDGERN